LTLTWRQILTWSARSSVPRPTLDPEHDRQLIINR
jgi:hypothetical protein